MSADPTIPLSEPNPANGEVTKQERQWAMYAHVAAPVFCIVGQQIHAPLWCFAAPLAIYFIKKNESAFVAKHAKEAVNFTVMVWLMSAALFFGTMQLAIVRQDDSGASSVVWMVLTSVLALGALSLYAVAALKALDGRNYRYPLSLRIMR